MVRVNDRTYFTEEDKANVVYREYSKKEIEERYARFTKKRSKKRIVRMVVLCVLIIMAIMFEQLWLWTSIALECMVLAIIVGELIDNSNRKSSCRPYYVEIQIDKKLPREYDTAYESDDGMILDFFPIVGHDTTSGYQSVFYIDWQEYLDVEVDSKVKISLPVIGDALPSAPDNLKNDRKREDEKKDNIDMCADCGIFADINRLRQREKSNK